MILLIHLGGRKGAHEQWARGRKFLKTTGLISIVRHNPIRIEL